MNIFWSSAIQDSQLYWKPVEKVRIRIYHFLHWFPVSRVRSLSYTPDSLESGRSRDLWKSGRVFFQNGRKPGIICSGQKKRVSSLSVRGFCTESIGCSKDPKSGLSSLSVRGFCTESVGCSRDPKSGLSSLSVMGFCTESVGFSSIKECSFENHENS